MVHLAYQDHRVHLVLQVYQENQVFQASMERKEQRDQEDPLAFRVWMDSLDNRVKRETEEREETGVSQAEMVDYLDLQDLPDLQGKSSTSHRVTEEMKFQVEQDSRDPWDQREKKGNMVFQDMQRRERKESLVSSWGLMEDRCTWGASQDSRVRWDPRALWDLLVSLVLLVRRERSVFQADRVDRG